MKTHITAICCLFLLCFTPHAHAEQFDFDGLLKRSFESYGKVNDYVCLFSKKERIRDSIKEERNILFKYRKPASFYMKWTEGDNRGVEAIYVDGRYNNKLEVHLAGFWRFFRIAVDPHGLLALKNNRHPITEAGIGHLLDLIMTNYHKGKSDPESRITFEGEPLVDGKRTVYVKAVFPKDKGYYGQAVHVYFDQEAMLPVKLTVYGWSNEFLEEYRFESLRLNAGLTERDFDVNNSEYHF